MHEKTWDPDMKGQDKSSINEKFLFQFVRSRVGGIRTGPEKCAISIDRAADDTTLIFESRFESGNLAKAIQV